MPIIKYTLKRSKTNFIEYLLDILEISRILILSQNPKL